MGIMSLPEELMWSWKSFLRRGLHAGLSFGLVGGLAVGLVGGLRAGLVAGLVGGLLLGLLLELFNGLLTGMLLGLINRQIDPQMRLRPNQGIQTSGWNALRIGIGFGLVGGLLLGLPFGLFNGLLLGLFGGLVFGGQTYLGHYLLRLLLWYSGAIPWYYIRFLEEATERILLQRVGGGYRFIHPLFLDYFASLVTTPAPPSSVHSSPLQQP
jgi:hypothetical protein